MVMNADTVVGRLNYNGYSHDPYENAQQLRPGVLHPRMLQEERDLIISEVCKP